MGLLSDGWAYLDTNSKQIGALGTILFGISGAAAAWLAFQLNYYGWRPIVFVKGRGDGVSEGRKHVWAEFQIWNRRKYPIVIRAIEVDFGDARVLEAASERMDEKDWSIGERGRLRLLREEILEPAKASAFQVRAHVEYVRADAVDAHEVSVRVALFDPGRNKVLGIFGDSRRWAKDRQLMKRLNEKADGQ